MVEQDAATAEDVVTLAVVYRHPVRIQLGHAIRAARVEWRRFVLWNRLHLAEHLGGGGLVEANLRIDDAARSPSSVEAPPTVLASDASEAGRLDWSQLVACMFGVIMKHLHRIQRVGVEVVSHRRQFFQDVIGHRNNVAAD